jgi:hypothetical protein
MNKFIQFCQMVGLHPLVGFGMFAVDVMLFGGESLSIGATWPISIAVATALTIPCVLIQKYGMRESWGLAIGKGVMVGLLTAIPTSIPSIITLAGGVVGTVALLADGRNSPVDDKY